MIYRALLWLATVPVVAHLLWHSVRDGGWRYLVERCGYAAPRRPGSRWVHAASVGELLTVMPLLKACLDREPHAKLLISTTTPTAAAILQREAEPRLVHVYLPIDWPGATARFLDRTLPTSSWIVETEIWPWLYARCCERGIPLTIINGRISDRTHAQRRGILANAYATALEPIDVLARTAADAQRFTDLGARRVRTTGNLKFADNRPHATADPLIDRPYCLLASSHADEEHRFADAWLTSQTSALLVIAPRHPERGSDIKRRLDELCRTHSSPIPRQRSARELPQETDRLYLADTLGEMQAWYAHAEAVAVGGSWVPKGGHNVLEPARHGRAIIVGPHTHNFADACKVLRDVDAIITTDTAGEAVRTLLRLLHDPAEASDRGQRAMQVSLTTNRIVDDYLCALGVTAA